MRLTNITRALEVPTASKVRTEEFYSLPGEKSYFATREYLCGLLLQPFLPAPRLLERFASVPSGEERASKLSYLGERSKPCENARAREASRGQRNTFSSPPQLSRLLSRASRASTFHDIPQMESLLAGYVERGETRCFLQLELTNIDCTFRGTPMSVVKISGFDFLGRENKQKLYFKGYTLHP